MQLRKAWRVARRIWIAAGITFTVVFVVWSVIAYRANREARAATASSAQVRVTQTEGLWRFQPTDSLTNNVRLVFFPGALVDPRAYAPLARAVASAGFPVALVELPRRGAFGGAESLELELRIRAALEADGRIVIAGHSRGAVVASRVANTRRERVAGLVIIGSSHPRDEDLSGLEIPVTKIVGTRDGLASPAEVRGNEALLPQHTRWVWVEGGNHSQFGWYGFQPMDRFAQIEASEQRRIMLEALLDLLHGVAET